MSSRSERNQHQQEIPGTISILSRQNTLNSPSLVQDVWEYEHDPDDQFLLDAFNKQSEGIKRHSYQEINKSGNHKHYRGAKNGQPKLDHFSQVTIEMEKKNEYGLMGSEKMIHDRKTVNKNKRSKQHSMKDYRTAEKPYELKIQNQIQIQQSPSPTKPEHHLLTDNEHMNRDVDILQRKIISNLNYLLTQTKQLLSLNKFTHLEIDREQTKKNLMKMEIDLRKLRITLRSNNSSSRINDFKKHNNSNTSLKKNKFSKSIKGYQSDKEEELMEFISKEKKKMNELSTRESTLNNYYAVIKNKRNNIEDSSLRYEKMKKKQFPNIMNEYQKLNYLELLTSKRQILRATVLETQKHIKKKCEQVFCEKRLIKDQIEIVQNKIKKIEEINMKNWVENNAKSNFYSKKITKNEQSKSKRKLNFKPNSHEKQDCSQSKHINLERVKSHKEFLRRGKVDKYKQQNEYFINTRYYRAK